MRTSVILRWIGLPSLAIVVIVGSAFAEASAFRRVQLPHGISLEIPSHWKVLPQETRQNLRAASEAAIKNSGIEGPRGEKVGLLAVNATPDPTGAMIRVSTITPSETTQADLAAITATELSEVQTEVYGIFKKLEAASGPKIIGMEAPRVERVNNQVSLVMRYTRTDTFGSSPWQVTQYKIPVPNRLIEITLSHRQSDGILWKPILERVKNSIRF